ncbi:MAG: hypothetical protein GY823_12775 [Flavobacteriaceae bacterium]|nr:hypothetical protein [Flavobacteriaceae bacterium]
MKKYVKFIFGFLLILVISIACTNDDSNIELAEVHQSTSIQNALNQLRSYYHEDGTINEEMNPTNNLVFDFCFEFIYPLSLSYNNEVIVTVNSVEELVNVIINSSQELYITGVVFPFDVTLYDIESNELIVQTINNEEEFSNLIANCYFNDPCICTEEYDPVCVEIIANDSLIVITFPNSCYAFCEGFTESDLVNCENNTECTIYDLEVITGDCTSDNTYNMTINFQYEEIGEQEFFDLYARNDELIGYFPLSSLPLTIINFPSSGENYDFVKVCINDNLDCCKEIEWLPPNCNGQGSNCEITSLDVVAGECNDDGSTYNLLLDFDFENTNGQEFFEIYFRDDVFYDYFQLSALPITINDFPSSGLENDFIKIVINDMPECSENIEWINPCFSDTFCYEYVFPIEMIVDGQVWSVNSNEHVDYKLSIGGELIYPLDIRIDNEIFTVWQGILEGAYGDRCD